MNWTKELKSDFVVEVLDMISVRGYGRLQLRKVEGKTKKERVRVEMAVLKS